MRIIFMGTPEFAIPSLRVLIDHEYIIAAVVTVPDRPAGRGRLVSPSPVKSFALQNGLDVLQPERLADPAFIEACSALQPDLIVVVAFRILPPAVYRLGRLGAFNLHASLLPKYRGAAPINRAIMNGEKETGVTTFFLQEKVDTGNIILQARTPIGEDMTAGELHDALAEIGAEIVLHSVRLIESGSAKPRPQNDSLACGAPKLIKEECRIDWSRDALQVHNFIRGLSPRPCAFTAHEGTTLRIYRSRRSDTAAPVQPGTVIEAGDTLRVAAGAGSVEILELQQEGKRRMEAQEFVRGYSLKKGDFLA